MPFNLNRPLSDFPPPEMLPHRWGRWGIAPVDDPNAKSGQLIGAHTEHTPDLFTGGPEPRRPVRFIRGAHPFALGQVAGFNVELAAELVAKGWAEFFEPEGRVKCRD